MCWRPCCPPWRSCWPLPPPCCPCVHVQETAACADGPVARPGGPAGLSLRPVVHVSMYRRQRRVLTALLPALAVLLALTSAVLGAIWSEPFLLYRLCRGQCDSFNTERGGGSHKFCVTVWICFLLKPVFRIRVILVRICGSEPLTNGSGSGSGSCYFRQLYLF